MQEGHAQPAGTRAPPGGPAIFIAKGLAKTYQMGEVKVVALIDVDLTIYQGEFIVLLGPSGSGKSTLLNILGGLDSPTSGSAQFADHDLTGATDAELTAYRREHVGFVFQFYNLIPSLTVRENVQLVTDIADHPMPVDEAIDRVGLTPRRDHFPAQLSGGEQQRVAIARAIVKRPDVLAPVGGERRLGGGAQVLLAEQHLAGAGHVQPAEDVQQRGLAAARRPEQHDELAAADLEIHIAQGMHFDLAGAVDLGEVVGAKDGRCFSGGGHSAVDRNAAAEVAGPFVPQLLADGGRRLLP